MAVSVIPQTVDENLLLVRTTLPAYQRTLINETVRQRLWLALMMRYGRISYNHTGTRMVWNYLYKEPEVVAMTRPTNIVFNDGVYNDQLNLGWRGGYVTESVHYDDLRLNGGPEKLLDISGTKLNACANAVRKYLSRQMYANGDAVGSENDFHGLGSFQKFGGTCTAADRIKVPSGTYAGKSITLGGQGGSWSSNMTTKPNATLGTDWPYGDGSTEYDPLSTLGVNYTSTAWNGSAGTWATVCEKVMRWTKTAILLRGALDADAVEINKTPGSPKDSIDQTVGSPPLINFLSGSMWNDTMNYFSARNYQFVPIAPATDLGFRDVFNFDGMGFGHDTDVPEGQGNLLSFGAMEIRSTYNDVFMTFDPQNKVEEQRVLYLMRVHANMRFRPKCFATYRAFA